ncbi:hypothetical protein RYX36_024003 [Vicia faba]
MSWTYVTDNYKLKKPIPSVVEPETFLKHKNYFFKKPIVPIVKHVYVPIYKGIPKEFLISSPKFAPTNPTKQAQTFFYATFVLARNDPSGNEVKIEGKLTNEGVTKPSLEVLNEDEKFLGFFHPKHKLKGYFHKKPIYYKLIPKYIPTYKPFHKPIIVKKHIPYVVELDSFLKNKHYFFKKLVYVPIYKLVLKVIPIYKPTPKVIPIYKRIPKVIPIVKPIH